MQSYVYKCLRQLINQNLYRALQEPNSEESEAQDKFFRALNTEVTQQSLTQWFSVDEVKEASRSVMCVCVC